LHGFRRKHNYKHFAGGQLLQNLLPPRIAAMESTQDIVPDSTLIIEHAAEILRKPGAELVIDVAMADKDAMFRLRWCAHTLRSLQRVYRAGVEMLRCGSA